MNLKIDHNSPLPLHIQVEALLRKLLHSAEYRDGALLPKEVELSSSLGVSRNTIRQATNRLEQEGVLVRKNGVGSKAAPKKPLFSGLDHWYSFTRQMKERGLCVINLSLNVCWVPANKMLAVFFNIEKGRKVLKLSRLKGTSGYPIVFFESYFHPRIGIQEADDFEAPLYTMLEKQYGVVVLRSSENISAQQAGKWSKKLDTALADPILIRERFIFDSGDRPIEYNKGYYRSDKFIYSIDIKKG